MHPTNFLSGLAYVGEVTGKKQTYYVYRGPEHFVLASYNAGKDSYNVNVVSAETCEYIREKFGGRKKLTKNDVLNETKKPALFPQGFYALNALYALCASAQASISANDKSRELLFNVYKVKSKR